MEQNEALALMLQKTKVPKYIKDWYEQRAGLFGQYTQQYASMILIQHAIDNGAEVPKDKRIFDNGGYMIEH
ncbi:hypothetical protein [Metabacillus halosaccharovorans]|uniref:hypothetical protein n=1 Tax=Metabacillus halosaccharovorans TaxID=930124 RepID=UPI001C1F4C7B|nr:hypothetical protein [Metabacillus halosaccharovorans]MBU7593555.1 hypothetical protein [Metabacillus halosaccharovorans]